MIPTLYNTGLLGGGASGGGAVGGWVELARTTLGSNGDTITVSSLPDKRYYKFILRTHPADGNTDDIKLSFNGDTGSNYAYRRSAGGVADDTFTSTNNFRIDAANGAYDRHVFGYVANYASKEKLVIAHDVIGQTAGAGTAPYRIETAGKWANTSNAISSFTFTNQGTGNFASGSEAIILGYDPLDSHTNNFWQELASVDLSAAGDTLDTSSFTAKKYLWIQWYVSNDTGNINPEIRFNSDSGSNYARRKSGDGGADGTVTSQSSISVAETEDPDPRFCNMFVINNSSNEKLGIAHYIEQQSAGAANAPQRSETVFKWVNTSSQITSCQIINVGAGDFGTNSKIRVWGAD